MISSLLGLIHAAVWLSPIAAIEDATLHAKSIYGAASKYIGVTCLFRIKHMKHMYGLAGGEQMYVDVMSFRRM